VHLTVAPERRDGVRAKREPIQGSVEALQLVLLYAAYEPAKVERAALRW